MANIAILGSGGFGLALAVLCHNRGHKVCVWSKFQDEIDTIKRAGELKAKLPGVVIPKDIELSTDISCVKGKNIAVIGIPSAFVRSVCEEAAPFVDEKTVIVSTTKGLEDKSLKRMTEVVSECMPKNTVVALTGPSHAEEIARGIPTLVVAACKDLSVAEHIQSELSSDTFRIYTSEDVIGCEIGGALKNIIALAAGICDGMGYGDNTKAALMTRGLSEIRRLGVTLGGKSETFSGLTGIGDLIVTCTSMHSRNRRAGILIGQGVAPDEAIRRVGTVEGYYCAKTAYELSKRVGVEMPITQQLHNVLENGKDATESLKELMLRPYVSE
ncbi:MAG: NAD(P)-dependent glycerol-3-phosphate dehydrogenase [Ruminococcus sp.]|nr:NAD(P)-dependent glycerol-3-phosphate dehydrogenase [Ruminococcus sp.]